MRRLHGLLPFLAWLPRLGPRALAQEAWVGFAGAVLALPQSIAYALIAGLPPQYGLYAAMLPVAIACLWGSSRHMVGGPTAAISVVLYATVAPLAPAGSESYVQLVLLLTFLAGLLQWALGALRFGVLLNFVSHSATFPPAVFMTTSDALFCQRKPLTFSPPPWSWKEIDPFPYCPARFGVITYFRVGSSTSVRSVTQAAAFMPYFVIVYPPVAR